MLKNLAAICYVLAAAVGAAAVAFPAYSNILLPISTFLGGLATKLPDMKVIKDTVSNTCVFLAMALLGLGCGASMPVDAAMTKAKDQINHIRAKVDEYRPIVEMVCPIGDAGSDVLIECMKVRGALVAFDRAADLAETAIATGHSVLPHLADLANKAEALADEIHELE